MTVVGYYLAERFATELVRKLSPFEVLVSGSLRRRQPTECIELVAPDEPAFDSLAYRVLKLTSPPGANPLTAELNNKLPVRIWKANMASLGSTLLCTTGSPEFITALKELAEFKGFRLASDGLFRDNIYIVGCDEESIFAVLNLHYLQPEERIGKQSLKKIFRAYEWEVPSNSHAGSYWVRWDSPEYWNCECPGFQYRQDCSHIHNIILDLGYRRER